MRGSRAFPSFNKVIADAFPDNTRRSPYASMLGIGIVEVKPESIRWKLPVRDGLNSGGGAVHGGAIVSLVDHVRSGRLEPGSDIVAEARLLTLKKRVAAVRADVTVKDQLVAIAQDTGYVRDKLG